MPRWSMALARSASVGFGRAAPASPNTLNLLSAKQLAFGVKLYAADYDGRFPMHLSELIPDYIEASDWERLLFDTRKDIHNPILPKQDWLYFGAFLDEKNSPPVLIASPQHATVSNTRARVVIHADGTGAIVSEAEYQAGLRKTIAHLQARASAASLAPAKSDSPEKSPAP